MNFSKNLKELMIKNNLKNIELARLLKIDRANITYYLNGDKMPSYEKLEELTLILNCSYDDLLK